eukprot:scaffold31003_cov66-Phaeocystis_antarctica.AAC.3
MKRVFRTRQRVLGFTPTPYLPHFPLVTNGHLLLLHMHITRIACTLCQVGHLPRLGLLLLLRRLHQRLRAAQPRARRGDPLVHQDGRAVLAPPPGRRHSGADEPDLLHAAAVRGLPGCHEDAQVPQVASEGGKAREQAQDAIDDEKERVRELKKAEKEAEAAKEAEA